MHKRFYSFIYAYKGIVEMLRSQVNFRLHLIAGIAVVAAGLYFNISSVEWLVLVLTIFSVLITESFNTALEYLVDLISPEHHGLAGKIKDVAAGAVMLTSLMAVIVGVLIFGPYLF